MSRILPALALAALLGAAPLAAARAQALATPATPQAAQPAILTLDQNRLYAESRFGQALEKSSADSAAKLAAENRQIETELAAEEKSLTEQRATLSAEAFKPLAAAFDAKVERIRGEQNAKAKALQEARDAGRKTFFQAVLPVLADLMRQKGALAILDKTTVVLSFDSIDVTEAAIAAIDERLGDGPKD